VLWRERGSFSVAAQGLSPEQMPGSLR
jgi:hypothetical protein